MPAMRSSRTRCYRRIRLQPLRPAPGRHYTPRQTRRSAAVGRWRRSCIPEAPGPASIPNRHQPRSFSGAARDHSRSPRSTHRTRQHARLARSIVHGAPLQRHRCGTAASEYRTPASARPRFPFPSRGSLAAPVPAACWCRTRCPGPDCRSQPGIDHRSR